MNRWIMFFKRQETDNKTVYRANTKYRITTETTNHYIVNGDEFSKADEHDLYQTGDIVRAYEKGASKNG